MAGEEKVKVQGLSEFRRAIKQASDELPKELRKGFKSIADLVALKTKAAFEAGPGVAPKVAPSVTALAQQTSAAVRIGGAKYPFAMGAEFGSIRFKQFPAWRGSGAGAGYQLYPTIRAERERIEQEASDLITRISRQAFPD